jgi:hypothetical protein
LTVKSNTRVSELLRMAAAMLLVVSLPWLSGCARRQVLPVLLLPQKGYVAIPELLPDMAGIRTDFERTPNHRSYLAVAVIPDSDVFHYTPGRGSEWPDVHVRWSDGTNTKEHLSSSASFSGRNEELRYRVTMDLDSDRVISPTSVEIGRSRFDCRVVSLNEFRKQVPRLPAVR